MEKNTQPKPQATFMMPPKLSEYVSEVQLVITANSKTDIILDFSLCTFVSVGGLEWLEELLLRASSTGTKIDFRNVTPSIYKVFKIAKIDPSVQSETTSTGAVC